GGHSLFAAVAASRLRQNPSLSHLSIADIYAHPTVRGLAQHIESQPRAAAVSTPAPDTLRHSSLRVLAAGAVQLFLLYMLFAVLYVPIAASLGLVHAWLSPVNLLIASLAVVSAVLLV